MCVLRSRVTCGFVGEHSAQRGFTRNEEVSSSNLLPGSRASDQGRRSVQLGRSVDRPFVLPLVAV